MAEPKLDEEQIYNVARTIDSPESRADYLRQVCGNDVALAERVHALLRVTEEDKSFLASPVAVARDHIHSPANAERPGTVIGPYKLLDQIGEGGFGVVFLAEQTQPVHRNVALKILKPGMETRQIIGRFEAERQALAIMDHANIAKVFDGGTTPSGRPYFVMELVRGIPITNYCDERHLTLRQRLNLFVPVCHAVHHAHQKGIIHRDLKPSNVLVTPSSPASEKDLDGIVKVIDFGIAKAIGPDLTHSMLLTGIAQIVGTPLYMSPEQAGLGDMDIDTRSDIYSLGVLLYELLTGTTPFTKDRFERAAYDEIRRIIRDEEPPIPSARLSESKDSLPSISAQRQMEPAKLTKLLRGELDWIVMKALDKDRNRRYAAASALVMDVQRYLHDEPVEASPPSAIYRWRKMARKNQRLLATVAAFFLLLISGLVVSTHLAYRATLAEKRAIEARDAKEVARQAEAVQRQRADAEAAIATAVNEFLQNDLLGQADIGNQPGSDARNPNITVREVLDRAANGLGSRFQGQELTEAAVHLTLGRAYGALGELERAQKHFERATELRSSKLGADHPEYLHATIDLARLLQERGQYDEAESLYRQVLTASEKVLGSDHPDALMTVNNLGSLYNLRGQHELAEQFYLRALEGRRRTLGADHPDTLETMNNVASLYWEWGRFDQAEPLFQQVQAQSRAIQGDDHPLTILAMQNLATLYYSQGRYDEAEKLFRQVLEIRRRVEGDEHPHALMAMNNLAATYMAVGRLDEAELLMRKLLDVRIDKLGVDHPDTLVARANLAGIYWKQKKLDQAIPLLEETLAQQRDKLGVDHPDTLITLANLGFNYREAGRVEEGMKCLEEALELAHKVSGPMNTFLAGQFGELANIYSQTNQLDKADALYRELLELAISEYGEDEPRTAKLMHQLGLNLIRQQKFDEATTTLRTCLAIRGKGAPDDWTTFNTKSLLGEAILGQKKYAEAEPLLLEGHAGLEQRRALIPPNVTALQEAGNRLIQLYSAWDKPDLADRWRKTQAAEASR